MPTPPLESKAPSEPEKDPGPPAEAKPAPAPAAGELRSSGTIGAARGELRSASREQPKANQTPSVVIDMGAAAEPPPAAAVEAPAATPPSGGVRATGVMQARPSAVVPAAPAPSGFSIEVDPALMAEMAAHDAAKATPPPATRPAAATKPTQEFDPAPAPALSPARPSSNGVPAPDQPQAAHPPAGESGKRSLRPSSEFDALERDFFAREADLYKQEHPETFDDLDHGRPKPR